MSRNDNEEFTGNPLFISFFKAVAIMGILVVVIGAFNMLLLQPTLARELERAEQARCRQNLMTFYTAFVRYSHGHDGALTPIPPHMEFFGTLSSIDMMTYRCPAADSKYEDFGPDVFMAVSDYIYLGYAVRDQQELDVLARQYIEQVTQNVDDPALETLGTTELPLPPLRFDLDDAARIPLLIEADVYHGQSGPQENWGGHVLFLDGHIEYLHMNEKFPMTDHFFEMTWMMENPGREY